MLTFELSQHDLKQNKVCILFSPSQSTFWLKSITGNQKVRCPSTVCCHTFIPTFVRSSQLAVIKREERRVNRNTHTSLWYPFILQTQSTQEYNFWTEAYYLQTYNFIMGGNDDQLTDSYNILNQLENTSVSYWTRMILTMLYPKCQLAYIGKNPILPPRPN
jgi:hypothetical protein